MFVVLLVLPFRENVGRQGGAFPDINEPQIGIDINTIADYFTIANRSQAYLSISVAIAHRCPRYIQHFIQHLITVKVKHWDPDVRILTSQALYHLTPLSLSYCSIQ